MSSFDQNYVYISILLGWTCMNDTISSDTFYNLKNFTPPQELRGHEFSQEFFFTNFYVVSPYRLFGKCTHPRPSGRNWNVLKRRSLFFLKLLAIQSCTRSPDIAMLSSLVQVLQISLSYPVLNKFSRYRFAIQSCKRSSLIGLLFSRELVFLLQSPCKPAVYKSFWSRLAIQSCKKSIRNRFDIQSCTSCSLIGLLSSRVPVLSHIKRKSHHINVRLQVATGTDDLTYRR
jgi:hypothetical protein